MKKLIIASILLFAVMYPPQNSIGGTEFKKPLSTINLSKQKYDETVESFFNDFEKLQMKLDSLETKIKHK